MRRRILAIGVLALMLGSGRERGVIKRWMPGLTFAFVRATGRRRSVWDGEPVPRDRACGRRGQGGTLRRFWRPVVLAGMIVGLLVGPSTALAASGWSAPALVDPPVAPATTHSVFVSCPSASFCAAVDYEGNALTFNGSSWSAPAKIDGTAYGLTSVSCPSSSFCVAVDHGGNALTFNGSSWSAPRSIDATGNVLTSVSCPSASFCVAVDLDFAAWAAHLLGYGYAMTFNGSSWSAPALVGVGGLESVSCPSPSFCTVVNDDGGALMFNGSTWSAPTRLLSGPPGYAPLTSVSCPSATFCATVDQQGDAWTFNGSSWSYAPIDGLLPLTSVSCPSSSFCIAVDRGTSVGYEGYPGGHALTFNGSSWSAPTTIDNAALNSVSCPSPSFCAAIDYLGQALTYSSPSSSGGGGTSGGGGGTGGGGSPGGGSGGGIAAPVASVPGRVGTPGAVLRFKFACRGAAGQRCQGQATASAIEKLSAAGKRVTGVLASKPRAGRYRVVVVATGSLSARAGGSSEVSIRLNPTGQMLRSRFKKLPADVKVTATADGRTTTIGTAKVTFGADPPMVSIAGTLTTKRGMVAFSLRCRGLAGQLCTGALKINTFEKLSVDGRKITGLAYGPSGKGKLVTIAGAGWSVKAGKAIKLSIGLNATGKTLLSKFGRIPGTLAITPTYNGYTLASSTVRIAFKR